MELDTFLLHILGQFFGRLPSNSSLLIYQHIED
jgi:hypothetical protein